MSWRVVHGIGIAMNARYMSVYTPTSAPILRNSLNVIVFYLVGIKSFCNFVYYIVNVSFTQSTRRGNC
jgi:hypothetical protein